MRTLYEVAEQSVGSWEGAPAAKLEIQMLLEDYVSRSVRIHEIMQLNGLSAKQILIAKKLLEIE